MTLCGKRWSRSSRGNPGRRVSLVRPPSRWRGKAESATLIGRRLGPYEILARIGGGGMGDVYKARDTRLPRSVAVKVPKAPYSERFRREVGAIAQLNHPHICTLYDAGPDYLVMEYVEGTPLKGPLPADRAVAYARQILDALETAHRQHVIHRDLKPDNILVTKQGIKLLDFGLAHTQSGEGEPSITRTGDVMGTPAHPPALDRIITQCLAETPDDRFQSAHDMKLALDWAIEPQPTVAPARGRRLVWMATAAAVVIVASWTVSRLRPMETSGPVLRFQINPPEGGQFGRLGTGFGPGVALSPDGRTAVFGATVDGQYALWLRTLDDTKARLLRGSEDARFPFWSPDGKSIAFFARGKLRRIDLAGGPVFEVCDIPSVIPGVYGGSWTPDGRMLVGVYAGNIASVPASGGTLAPLTAFNSSTGDVAHAWPQVLPGGRFLYWAGSSMPEHNGVVYAASLEKPNERIRLVKSDTRALYTSGPDGRGYLLWRRGETLVAQEFNGPTLTFSGEPRPIADAVGVVVAAANMAVAVSSGGTLLYAPAADLTQLTLFDRAGKRLGAVSDPGIFNSSSTRFSPDGSQIATTRQEAGRDLWLIDVNRGTSRRTTHDSRGGYYPQWSPDSRTILFVGENVTALYRKDATGATPDQRLASWPAVDAVLSDWSRDGHFVLNTRHTPGTGDDIWMVPVAPDGHLAADAPAKPYLRTPVNESAARFSPQSDPRWVAYQSDESGRDEVYVQSFPEPRGSHRISTNGGSNPQWGPGGRELFYQALGGKVMAVNLKLGLDSVEASAPRELFTLPSQSVFEVAPDGQRFLVNVPDPTPRPLTVIVNGPALMKQPGSDNRNGREN